MAILHIFKERLSTQKQYSELFKINPSILKTIRNNIDKKGYNEAFPVICWQKGESLIVIDGHTRLQACMDIERIVNVPVCTMGFDSSTEAIQYAIKCQINRRNLTDAEIMNARETLKRCTQKDNQHVPHGTSTSAKDEAELFNTSERTVKRQRFVDDNATPEQKEEITSGKKSYNAIYNNIKGTPVNPDKELKQQLYIPQISNSTPQSLTDLLCRTKPYILPVNDFMQ